MAQLTARAAPAPDASQPPAHRPHGCVPGPLWSYLRLYPSFHTASSPLNDETHRRPSRYVTLGLTPLLGGSG